MNDAHDNAADDRAMYRRIQTDQAIEAFRRQELKRLQLEMAEYALERLLNGRTDTVRYATETEQIRHQMELKRADYERLGKLPKTIGPNPPEDKEARPEDYWRDARQPQPEPERCQVCGKVHGAPEVVTHTGVRLWPGHEYIIRTIIGTQKLWRQWRMGYLGFGNGTEWSARGPDRTHGDQYGGTQHIDLGWIVFAEEVERDDRLRHTGVTEVELARLRRKMSGPQPARTR